MAIATGLREAIGKHQPEMAAIEGVFHAVNTQTAIKLAHVRGVAMLAIGEAGLPVGEYSPDWAIVFERDGEEHLYLVRETKDTLNLDDLEWDEAMRIRFAAKHFAVAPRGAVDFINTTDKAGIRLANG